jgi:hypothetical protein
MGEVPHREVTVKVPREHVPHVRDDLIVQLGSAADELSWLIGRYHDPSAPPLKLDGDEPEPVPAEHVHAKLKCLYDCERLIDQLGWDLSEDADRLLKAPPAFLHKLAIDGVRAASDSVNGRAGDYDKDPRNHARLRWYRKEEEAFMAILDQLEEELGEEGSAEAPARPELVR